MKHIDWTEALKTARDARNYEEARAALRELGLDADTIILRADWNKALKVRALTYNPADLGMDGKLDEIEYRLSQCKASAVRWSFFRAHDPSRSDSFDDARRIENKSGAGDWFTAEGGYERVLAVMARSGKKLRWNTSEFCIICTFAELCEYLEQYNAKGLGTWFPQSKAETRMATTLIRMQEWKTSKKKIAYLQACPYNQDA